MTDSLARRGPDSEGVEAWDRVVLGHRRLSIFDLSDAGRQPMTTPDRSLAVVFNGAIYNFQALRSELRARGHAFGSAADTEVLLYGYLEWGIEGLIDRLRGMFAFALWDDRRGSLYLVRDRLGIKPLLVARKGGTLAFASTVRALRAAGLAEGVDPEAMMEFLDLGFVTDQRCIYEGVEKVPAATWLEWRGGLLRSTRYWTPPAAAASGSVDFDAAVEETERLFLQAVERRLDADVPVGTLLSGGIDSGLVCWAVRRLGADLTAFTVGTPGDVWDETSDARETAAALGVRHRVLPLSPADAPGVDELVDAYAEPFGCASALGMLAVSRAVSPVATVLLTGDGGDDVFLGYPRHRHLFSAQRVARMLPSAAAAGWYRARGAFPRGGALGRVRHFADYATGGLGAFLAAGDGLPLLRGERWLGERLRDREVRHRTLAWSHDSARNVLTDYLAHDLETQFVAEYLTKVDGATMHHALEARSPFLDQDLWEFAARLPLDLRLRGGQLKAVLREMARRHLGRRTAGGRKRGFSIPVQRWVAGQWRGAVAEALRDSVLEREGWIDAAPVRAALERSAREGSAPLQLWYLFVLESWLRAEDRDGAREASAVA